MPDTGDHDYVNTTSSEQQDETAPTSSVPNEEVVVSESECNKTWAYFTGPR